MALAAEIRDPAGDRGSILSRVSLASTVRQPALELGRSLLGWRLHVREDDGSWTGGVIVETEAYPGGEDLASHSAGGRRTPRHQAMYLPGGHLYVYLIYGVHHCLNIVSGRRGSGEAVLVRAIRPTCGVERMRSRRKGRRDRDLARGPGRLCQALSIDLALDGMRLERGAPVRLSPGRTPTSVVSAARVGVASAGDWGTRPWRFLCGDPEWWSVRPRQVGC